MGYLEVIYTSTMPAPVVIAMLVISWRGGQAVWLCAEFIGTVLAGLSLLLTPKLLLYYLTEVRLDNVSIHLARVVGTLLLSTSMDTHRAISSGEKKEWSSVSRSRTITTTLLLLSTIYAHRHYPEWGFRFVPFTIVGTSCWLLPHLHYALFTPAAGQSASHAVSFFLLLDTAVTSSAGIAWYAYPQWVLRTLIVIRPNGVSVTMARVIGSLLLGLAAESYTVTQSVSLKSKKMVHCSRIVAAVKLICLLAYAETLTNAFNTLHIIFGLCTLLAWALNAALGYLFVSFMELALEDEERTREHVNMGKIKP